MTGKLPINIDHLLRQRTIEGERIEYKAGWNPQSVLHTVCAFANDFHNLGGGYIVLGVEEQNGRPVLPPTGIDPESVEAIQKELLNLGYSAIQPWYHPSSATYDVDGQTILVLWVPGGETRPYKAKVNLSAERNDWAYFIRRHSSTVRAKGQDERELLSLAATVPFDDRYRQTASLDDLSHRLIHPHKPEAERFWNFPIGAIEEALVNAIYHRSYEEREPVEVRITREELLVLSYPGADRSIRMDDFKKGQAVSRRYRNRRIGEFLKELDLAEARSTGVPKIFRAMRRNGSPEPIFESDEDRTWFLVRLPVHERASLAATDQDTIHDTQQDKSLKNKEKGQDTPQDTVHETIHETIHVTEHVERLISILTGEMNRPQLQDILGISNRSHFVEAYLGPALKAGLIEMTLPDKPQSRRQRYRRTASGEALAVRLKTTS